MKVSQKISVESLKNHPLFSAKRPFSLRLPLSFFSTRPRLSQKQHVSFQPAYDDPSVFFFFGGRDSKARVGPLVDAGLMVMCSGWHGRLGDRCWGLFQD